MEDRKNVTLKINICMSHLGNEDAGMSIADIEIFSGFVPDGKDLEKLEKDPNSLIVKFEVSNRRVVFVLEKVPSIHYYCFTFRVYREYIVGKTQLSTVKVYDYHNADAVCTKFYSPRNYSALVNTICDNGVCECSRADSCPVESPFDDLKEKKTAARREEMIDRFCFNFDYVWKGKIKGRIQKVEQFLNISFEILEVIREGVEKKEDLEGKVRFILSRDYCKRAYLYPGVTYLVMGIDPPARAEGYIMYYRYLFDKSSIIQPEVVTDSAGSKILERDLNYVTRKIKTNGCEE